MMLLLNVRKACNWPTASNSINKSNPFGKQFGNVSRVIKRPVPFNSVITLTPKNVIQKDKKVLCLRMLSVLLVKKPEIAVMLISLRRGDHYINYGIRTQWTLVNVIITTTRITN